ncbi:hypothetical protein ACFFP0_29525 [Rhizobium puerariae]|uniref:Uncharacterized protein n=1 Tax=Rhizobium puerariae TaxID=1585791 RepID=A0ABV6AQT4_9HYPH
MPNLKIYLDDSTSPDVRRILQALLGPVRHVLCEELGVEASACQLALLSVVGIEGQPKINIEISVLPKPDRTTEKILKLSRRLQGMVAEATALHAAVRIATLDASTYVASK